MTKDKEKFFTRKVAGEGKKVPLSYPDGSESPHWVLLRGVDSDAYRTAFAEERKFLIEKGADGEIPDEVFTESRNRLLAKLVAGWSFEEGEPKVKGVIEFLDESPQIAEKLNTLAADRKYFFGGKGNASAK